MNEEQAKAFITFMIGRVGGGFHPDNLIGDYIDRDNNACFSEEEVSKYQLMLDEVFKVLGDGIYDATEMLFKTYLD
jgi:hypothetical protein